MTMINKEETVSKLTAEVKDIEAKIALMENGHLGTSTDHPGFRYLIGKRNAMYRAITLVSR